MAGRAYHQESVLQALEPGTCLTLDQLDDVMDLDRKKIVNATLKLIRRDYIERAEIGCYRLTKAGAKSREGKEELTLGPNKPLMRPRRTFTSFRTRIWRAIGVKDKFTIRELVATADPKDEKDPVGNAGCFIKALERAGYIGRLPVKAKSTSLTSNGFNRYRRLKHTGPLSPQVRVRGKELYDPNTEEIFSWT